VDNINSAGHIQNTLFLRTSIHWKNWENDQPMDKRPTWCQVKHVTQSALSEHNIETGHQILFDKTTTIANITSYFPRKCREAIELQKHPTNLNRDNGYNIKYGKLFCWLLRTDRFPPYLSPLPLPAIFFFLSTTSTSSVI